jgi:hypothetical protein
MAKFKVIEGTVWEIEADTLEEAKAFYEGHFNGEESDSLVMKEIEGSAYWYRTEYEEGRKAGGNEAVSWLEEVYGDGIHGTDAWAEFGNDTEDCECEYCTDEEEGE